MTIPYRPVRGLGASLLGDAQLEDLDLQDANLTQPGVVMRGAGASELPARVHQAGGGEIALDPTKGQALFYRPDVADDELCLVHNDTLYTSKPTEVTVNGTQAWRRVGAWAPWTLRETLLVQPLELVSQIDVATIRDAVTGKIYHVAVWRWATNTFLQTDTRGVYAAVHDESGAEVVAPTLLMAGLDQVNPRACSCDTGVVIAWADTTTFQYRSSAWRLSNPVEFSASALIVGLGAASFTPKFDMRKDGSADRVMFVHADVDGTPEIRGRTVTVTQVATFVASFVPIVTGTQGIALDLDPLGGYLVTWASATAVACVHVTSGFVVDTAQASAVTASPILRVTGCHVDGIASQGTVAVEQNPAAAVNDFRNHIQTFSYNGAALASVRTQRGAIIWGHAFVFRGRPLVWAEHYASDGVQEGVQLLYDLLTGAVLARAFPTSLGASGAIANPSNKGARYDLPTTPQMVDDAVYHAAMLAKATVVSSLGSTSNADSIGVTRVEATSEPRKPATVPGLAIDAHAGFPVVYDGAGATEADWHVFPSITSAVAAGGGALTAASTYVVGVSFRAIDREGDFWRSDVAVTSVALAAGQTQITLTVVPCRWTARRKVLLEPWVSLSNQGSPLYLDAANVRISTPGVDAQTIVLTSSDATRLANGIQLDQFPPTSILGHGRVSVTDFATYALARFWSPDPGRPDILRHTIDHDIGRDGFGWGWEDTQLIQLDTSVRPQALGELDGSLAVLAGNECHLAYGLGPDKQGSGLFGQPSKFGVVDLETSQARVVRVPDSAVPGGLAYATPRGLYLLRRDRVSQQLSAQVERLFRFDGVEPQAVAYAPEFGEIWLMTLTAEARSMRLSLTTGRWCADSARRAQDIAVSPRGVVAWLLPDSRVRILDETAIADGASNLLFKGETPTIRPDPSTVSTAYTLQQILLHTYLLAGPALLDVSIVDARTGQVITLLQQTYTALGPESRSVGPINLATYGHRVRYSQPAGDTGKIVIVEIDSQMQVSDNVISRTVTTL